MKAWDEDDANANASHVDKVEIIEKPKITKISKIKTELKKIKSSLKVVRVTSARKLKADSNSAKKQTASKRNNPFKVSKENSELSESNSGNLRTRKHKSHMPPLPISKGKSAPISLVSKHTEDKIVHLKDLYERIQTKTYFRIWKG